MSGLVVHSRAYVLTPHGEREIQLCVGDITKQPVHEKVDIILVSAFPNDYIPMTGSVIGALDRELGLSVRDLAWNHRKEDLRLQFNCWISEPLEDHLPFRQLVCFERMARNFDKPLWQAVEEIFRALFPAFNNENKSVITPLLGTGYQHVDMSVMMRILMKVAIGWIRLGLPMHLFKIVLYAKDPLSLDARQLSVVKSFEKFKKSLDISQLKLEDPPITTDIFFIFASKDEEKQIFVQKLLLSNKKLSVQTLKKDESKEDSWKYEVYMTMKTCARIVPLLTKAFLEDEACLDQYNIAICCKRTMIRKILAPICMEKINLPIYMGMVQWIDCRKMEDSQVDQACHVLITEIHKDRSAPQQSSLDAKYDMFISYSHRNSTQAQKVLEVLQREQPNLQIFFDYDELKTGVNWQQTLYSALDNCRCVLALVSGDYLQSSVCTEEFNLALARHLSKENTTQLVPLLLEDITQKQLPALSSLHPIRISNDILEATAKDIGAKLSQWFQDGQPNHIFPAAREPLNFNEVASRLRQGLFENTYFFQHGQYKIKHLENETLSINSSENEKDNQCNVFISHSSRDLRYAEFIYQSIEKAHPNVIVHYKSGNKDSTTELQFLVSAQVLVVLLSKNYLRSPKEVEELNVILGRERLAKNTRHLYVVKLNEIPMRPTYVNLVPCDTCLTDSFWADLEIHVPSAKEDFVYARWVTEDKHSKLSDREVVGLMKAVCDIEWKLAFKSSVPGNAYQDVILCNVVNLQSDLEKLKEGKDVKEKLLEQLGDQDSAEKTEETDSHTGDSVVEKMQSPHGSMRLKPAGLENFEKEESDSSQGHCQGHINDSKQVASELQKQKFQDLTEEYPEKHTLSKHVDEKHSAELHNKEITGENVTIVQSESEGHKSSTTCSIL